MSVPKCLRHCTRQCWLLLNTLCCKNRARSHIHPLSRSLDALLGTILKITQLCTCADIPDPPIMMSPMPHTGFHHHCFGISAIWHSRATPCRILPMPELPCSLFVFGVTWCVHGGFLHCMLSSPPIVLNSAVWFAAVVIMSTLPRSCLPVTEPGQKRCHQIIQSAVLCGVLFNQARLASCC